MVPIPQNIHKLCARIGLSAWFTVQCTAHAHVPIGEPIPWYGTECAECSEETVRTSWDIWDYFNWISVENLGHVES